MRTLNVAVLLATLLLAAPLGARGAEPAGKVEAMNGQVTAAGPDGNIRPLQNDAPVFSGDVISTGPNSKVRIVFSDQGVIFLRPSTRFSIDSYQHTGNPQQDESKFSLVRGGFRAVSGAIGQANKEKVKIETPVATIGIRGTDHEGRLCAGDCLDLANIGVSAPADGLYTGTNAGQTMVGAQSFAAGQYGYTTPDKVTVPLPQPPPILVGDPNLQGALSAASAKDTKEDKEPTQKQESQPKDQGGDTQGQGAQEEQGAAEERPAVQGGQPGGTPGGQTDAEPNDGGLDIPAQPPATRAIQCN